MATIAMATADLQDLSQLLTYSATQTSISSAITARTGTYSFRCASNTGGLGLAFPSRDEIYLRFAIYRTNALRVQVNFMGAGTTRGTLWLIDTQLFANTGTSLTTPTPYVYGDSPEYLNVWEIYEVYFRAHLTAGVITVKVNGEQKFTFSGATSLVTSEIDRVFIGHNFQVHPFYLDDIIVDDANWPGLGGIQVLTPTGNGSDQQWDSGSYADVDDNPPNDDTDYIATDAAVAAKQSFTLPAPGGYAPTRAGLFTKSKLDGVGSGSIRPYMGTNLGATSALTTEYQWSKDYWDTPTLNDVGVEVRV